MLSSLVVSILHSVEYPKIFHWDEGLRLHTSHRKEVGEDPKLLIIPPPWLCNIYIKRRFESSSCRSLTQFVGSHLFPSVLFTNHKYAPLLF